MCVIIGVRPCLLLCLMFETGMFVIPGAYTRNSLVYLPSSPTGSTGITDALQSLAFTGWNLGSQALYCLQLLLITPTLKETPQTSTVNKYCIAKENKPKSFVFFVCSFGFGLRVQL